MPPKSTPKMDSKTPPKTPRRFVNFFEAIELINAANIAILPSEKVFLRESCGRILSEDIVAADFNPRFPQSNMDGYAFRFADLAALAGGGLKIKSINRAGNEEDCAVESGECIKTFTGARIPKNADTIAIVEQVEVKNGRIFLKDSEDLENLAPQKWIRQRGENYARGDVLLRKNTLISPFDIGILAENNCVFVKVRRRPRVAVLASGDEVLEIGESPRGDNQIYSSNNHILAALAESLGCAVSVFGILKDSQKEIKNAIAQALENHDVVVTTGGMSKGDFDFTKDIVREFGECVFEGVKIKPGKVMSLVNCAAKRHIIALPGNPISCVVSFLLLGRLVIAKMLGLEANLALRGALLAEDLGGVDNERLEFVLADLWLENGGYKVARKHRRASYMINDLSGALIVARAAKKRGEMVEIIVLDELLRLSNLKNQKEKK